MNKYKVEGITQKNVEKWVKGRGHKWDLTVKMAHICMISLTYRILSLTRMFPNVIY